jgi:hypothetical protein
VTADAQRLLRMRAIEWAGQLPGFFPWLRPEGSDVLRFAEQVAGELGPNDGEVPKERIEQGRALLGPHRQQRLVERFVDRHPDQWAALRADSGEGPALERALAAGAVRVVISERRLPPLLRLDHLERGIAPAHSPREVLAVTLPPDGIWSAPDEQAAERAAGGAATETEWLRAITSVAVERLHEAHGRRVQALAASLRRRLPAVGFPVASALLEDAYGRVESSREFAKEVALALLPVYVARGAA